MEVLYPRCAGLDVHKETVVACVRLVADGKVGTRGADLRDHDSELLALSDWLRRSGCTHVAMEATGVYWKPVWHILDDGGFALMLANAAHVKNVPGRKTDVNDATWLADLLAHGLIRASFVPDAGDAGAARPAAHPQAAGAREGEPHASASRRRWRTPTSSWTR